jgi:hypothetical protein
MLALVGSIKVVRNTDQSSEKETNDVPRFPAYIPTGLNVQRNAHYEGDTITAGSAQQGQCGGTGVAALSADACRALCTATQDCHLFELTGQNTTTTADDCCYLKSSAKDYKYAPGTDVYFPASGEGNSFLEWRTISQEGGSEGRLFTAC